MAQLRGAHLVEESPDLVLPGAFVIIIMHDNFFVDRLDKLL